MQQSTNASLRRTTPISMPSKAFRPGYGWEATVTSLERDTGATLQKRSEWEESEGTTMGNDLRKLILGRELRVTLCAWLFVLIHFHRRFLRDLSDQTLLLPITALLAPPSVAQLQRPVYVISFIPCWEVQHDYDPQDPCHLLRRRPGFLAVAICWFIAYLHSASKLRAGFLCSNYSISIKRPHPP